MDLTSLGIDISILVAIVGIIELFKNKIDKENKFKKLYVFFPLILALIVSFFITEDFTIQEYFKNVFIYTGISSYSYDFIKANFLKKEEKWN